MIEVIDRVGVLSTDQKADLEKVQTQFSVKAVFERADSAKELGDSAEACVATPNMICIYVDPGHRWTSSRFGVDTGIKSADFQMVGRAGNLDFKEGHWADGVKAIVARANTLSQKVSAPTAVIVQEQKTVIEQPFPVWPWVVGFGSLSLFATLAYVAIRKQYKRKEQAIKDLKQETFEYASRNVNAQVKEDFDKGIAAAAGIGQTTGRISAAQPNMSNFPKAEQVVATSPPPVAPLREQRRDTSKTAVLRPPLPVKPRIISTRPPVVTRQRVEVDNAPGIGEAMVATELLRQQQERDRQAQEERDRRRRKREREEEEERKRKREDERRASNDSPSLFSSSSSSSYSSGGSDSSFGSSSSGGSDGGGHSGGGSDSSF